MERWSEQQYSIQLSWSSSAHTPRNIKNLFWKHLALKIIRAWKILENVFLRNIQYELRGAVNDFWKHFAGQSIICTAHIFIWSKRQWKLLLNYLWELLKKNNFPCSFSSVYEVSCVSPNPRSKVTLVGSLGPFSSKSLIRNQNFFCYFPETVTTIAILVPLVEAALV